MLQGTITNLFGEMVVVVAPYGLLSAPIPIPTATPMGFLSLVASSSHVSLDALRKLACRGVLSVASSRLASRPARPAANIPRTDRPDRRSFVGHALDKVAHPRHPIPPGLPAANQLNNRAASAAISLSPLSSGKVAKAIMETGSTTTAAGVAEDLLGGK